MPPAIYVVVIGSYHRREQPYPRTPRRSGTSPAGSSRANAAVAGRQRSARTYCVRRCILMYSTITYARYSQHPPSIRRRRGAYCTPRRGDRRSALSRSVPAPGCCNLYDDGRVASRRTPRASRLPDHERFSGASASTTARSLGTSREPTRSWSGCWMRSGVSRSAGDACDARARAVRIARTYDRPNHTPREVVTREGAPRRRRVCAAAASPARESCAST